MKLDEVERPAFDKYHMKVMDRELRLPHAKMQMRDELLDAGLGHLLDIGK